MSRFTSGPLAAVDLGSNSFHLAVGEIRDGVLLRTDKLKERVALAAGLTPERRLDPETRERALACLRRFRARIGDLPEERVRAAGTNTLRAIRSEDDFLAAAEEALGQPIHVIEGAEEARLVYRGVAWSDAPDPHRPRLVVDIGGGSTEVVVGRGPEILSADSLRMGCVTWSEGFFPGGDISADRYQGARFAASLELRSLAGAVRDRENLEVLGSSGTLGALGAILAGMGETDGRLTLSGLAALRERVIDAGSFDALDLPGLEERRRPVIVGGLAIADAVFDSLGLDAMTPVDGALREGLLAEMIAKPGELDRRDLTVRQYQERFAVNVDQADRVAAMLNELMDHAGPEWVGRYRREALEAARLHEIGLFLRRGSYHKHGHYLLEESDLPGFSRREQAVLAAFVLCHRRKFRHEALEDSARDPRAAVRTAALLRLAVRLCRGRSGELPEVDLTVDGDSLDLTVRAPEPVRPLVALDLSQEVDRLRRAGLDLSWSCETEGEAAGAA